MNRTIKDATVKVYHYDDLESLKAHVLAFVAAYNFAKHLKALQWRTPYQVICDAWTKDPSIFKINPHQLIPGPHTQSGRGSIRPGSSRSPYGRFLRSISVKQDLGSPIAHEARAWPMPSRFTVCGLEFLPLRQYLPPVCCR